MLSIAVLVLVSDAQGKIRWESRAWLRLWLLRFEHEYEHEYEHEHEHEHDGVCLLAVLEIKP